MAGTSPSTYSPRRGWLHRLHLRRRPQGAGVLQAGVRATPALPALPSQAATSSCPKPELPHVHGAVCDPAPAHEPAGRGSARPLNGQRECAVGCEGHPGLCHISACLYAVHRTQPLSALAAGLTRPLTESGKSTRRWLTNDASSGVTHSSAPCRERAGEREAWALPPDCEGTIGLWGTSYRTTSSTLPRSPS